MAGGVPLIEHPNRVCEGCVLAKQTPTPYPDRAVFRAQKPLQLVHADLCGPITPTSIGGGKYFQLLVDDFSRWSWVYMLSGNFEALDAFKRFKTTIEESSGLEIKTLHTDRGGEFTSQSFGKFCDENGITRHLTAPYSPQQNGDVERRNRTVMEMARSLLKGENVSGEFWGEAVRHAVYLLNRLPTKSLPDVTPYEAWYDKKPNLGHLKVFGCVVFAKNAGFHLRKLDDRSKRMVYFGVEDGTKGNRLYDPQDRKLRVARDVVFEEKEGWIWFKEKEEPKTVTNIFTVIQPQPEILSKIPQNNPKLIPDQSGSPVTEAAKSGQPNLETVQNDSTLNFTAHEPISSPLSSASSSSTEIGPQGLRSLADIYKTPRM